VTSKEWEKWWSDVKNHPEEIASGASDIIADLSRCEEERDGAESFAREMQEQAKKAGDAVDAAERMERVERESRMSYERSCRELMAKLDAAEKERDRARDHLRKAERDAFVAGAQWAWGVDPLRMGLGAEALRRYPDKKFERMREELEQHNKGILPGAPAPKRWRCSCGLRGGEIGEMIVGPDGNLIHWTGKVWCSVEEET